jgi:hypothetical protein
VRAVAGLAGLQEALHADAIDGSSDDSDDKGALSAARSRLTQELGSAGFVDPAGGLLDNFRAVLGHHPVEMDIDDLRPGLLSELSEWVASVLEGTPEQAVDAQAHVRPQAAIKLLT